MPEPLRGSGTCFAVARSHPLVRVGCAVHLGETVTYRFVQYLGSTVELGGHLGRSETLKQVTYHVGYAILRVNIALTSTFDHPLAVRGPPHPRRRAHTPTCNQRARSRAIPTHARALPAAAAPNASRGLSHTTLSTATSPTAAARLPWPPHWPPRTLRSRHTSLTTHHWHARAARTHQTLTRAQHPTRPITHAHTAYTPATAASAFTLSRALSHAPCTHTAGHARHRARATRKQACKHATHTPRTQRTPHNAGTAPSTAHTCLIPLSQLTRPGQLAAASATAVLACVAEGAACRRHCPLPALPLPAAAPAAAPPESQSVQLVHVCEWCLMCRAVQAMSPYMGASPRKGAARTRKGHGELNDP